MLSTPALASWGCSPTVAHTSPGLDATSMAAADWAASVPTLTKRPTPAARAAARWPSTSSSPGYGRWQWEPAHMAQHGPSEVEGGPLERLPDDVRQQDDG